MGLEDVISWYQKKIGTYDKQQWEKTVEQRIVYGLNHIQLKTTKLKTDLIDLDLIRGSSFPKAKPKHGLLTVARLSTLRLIFLPLYSKWWVQQTSGKIFSVLLLLYLFQLLTIANYSFSISSSSKVHNSQNVPISEVMVPIIMFWVLSFIHSQIVATIPNTEPLKVVPKYRKTFRRRRSRKINIEKNVENDENKPKVKKIWDSKDRLNKTTSKNVLFEKNHVIIPNQQNHLSPQQNLNVRRINGIPLDDDGFESLNGNGSSPSDNGEILDNNLDNSKIARNKANNGNDENDKESSSGIRCNEWVKEVQDSRSNITMPRRQSAPDIQYNSNEIDSDSDTFTFDGAKFPKYSSISKRRGSQLTLTKTLIESTCETDEEGECETMSSPETTTSGRIDATASGAEWMGVTTNSEDCSYSSEISESDAQMDMDAPPTSILNPYCAPSDRVSCTIWDRKEIKKADLSVIEISSCIIVRVEAMPQTMDCFYMGIFLTTVLSMLPILCRFCFTLLDISNEDEMQLSLIQISHLVISKINNLSLGEMFDLLLGTTFWERTLMIVAAMQRWILGFLLFFLLAVAERTFKQKFLYAKLFSHLTSSRRAKKSELPHFRLNKVRNIKTWLSVRSYLKKRGPQRSVEVIVSASFIVALLLLSFLCVELLKESFILNSQYNLEIMIWCTGLGIFILRYMTLGVKINKKYRNLSVLITEQINLYLQIEQKPHKKEELMVANSVLKLAADLLKELESQFKILGLSANPLLYNITKVVILSALSGVLSEILGFKLKLHKIKLK